MTSPPGASPPPSKAGGLSLPSDREVTGSISVLIVDDELTVRESCASLLRQSGYQVSVAAKGEEALQMMRRRTFDIVLLDLYMKGMGGMEVLREIHGRSPATLVIVMTGKPSVDSSIEAFQAGAWDYLSKPFSATQLSILIGRATHSVQISRDSEVARDEFRQAHELSDRVPVLGKSPAFRKAIELAQRVAPTDASVFITGDSGTGKELVAQLIHAYSRRSARKMVAINCAALPETLLESEVFGHVKGAFTGAVSDHPGLLEQADGGTLFLDELTEMSLAIQAKLLRAIQDGVVRRVGSSVTSALVNVRFVVATNRDPAEAMREGHLRKDLYYRLRVVPIHLPPLRERASDIPILAEHFLAQFWKRHRSHEGFPTPGITPEGMEALQRRPWHGNVRELQNVLEHAVVVLEPGRDLGPDDIPVLDGGESSSRGSVAIDDVLGEPYHEARDRVVAEFEQQYLREIIRRADGNKSEAARMAGVDRTTLYRLMQKHELSKDDMPDD
ncbi:MAG: sigma-54-dependent Fis family transcriptional regulator [Gemmatimonadales bacterium]|nr:MAG: sigma-54-dependent Fis family transcriptional regulator [Gemmatimonadales bacterium]